MAKANSSSFNSVSKYFILELLFSVIKPCILANTKLIQFVSVKSFLELSFIVFLLSVSFLAFCFISLFVGFFNKVSLVEVAGEVEAGKPLGEIADRLGGHLGTGDFETSSFFAHIPVVVEDPLSCFLKNFLDFHFFS